MFRLPKFGLLGFPLDAALPDGGKHFVLEAMLSNTQRPAQHFCVEHWELEEHWEHSGSKPPDEPPELPKHLALEAELSNTHRPPQHF